MVKQEFMGFQRKDIFLTGSISIPNPWCGLLFSLILIRRVKINFLILDFKNKISSKYFNRYLDQLRVILANLYRINNIQEGLYVFYSRDFNDHQKSKRDNPNGVSIRPLIFLADNLKEYGWINHISGHYDKEAKRI